MNSNDRSRKLGALLRADSIIVRLLIFAAMSAIFFLFVKITEKKIPSGIAPDTTYGRTIDTTKPTTR
ncbi:MAG: hypothetical protein ACYDBH_23490 [Acidobacteriaceae bacterium]